MNQEIFYRPRRLRANPIIRNQISETELRVSQFVQPYFLSEEATAQSPIPGFTAVFRWGVDALSKKMESDIERGLRAFLLFGSHSVKDGSGSWSTSPDSVVPEAIRVLKKRFSHSAFLITDVCLCPYTDHGHCGLIVKGGEPGIFEVDNDASLLELSRQALCHAQAGADWVAPSDMMDGRVGIIRCKLDTAGFSSVGILSYTAKFASNYYGPFRGALETSPKLMDRSSYQMDFRNAGESLRELKLDIEEGADMVMVKPALAYLDIIASFRTHSSVPVAAYSVSGEYEMVKQLAAAGMVDERRLAVENLTAIKRAGAQVIITYFASIIAEKGWLHS